MAKRLSEDKWEPGFIYRLCFQHENTFIPFYVGETIHPETREAQHRRGGINDADGRLVYEAINQMNDAGVSWRMEIVGTYGSEGPGDAEDHWVLKTIYDGFALTNMKRGNARWMERMEAEANEMHELGIDDPKVYRARKKAELMKDEGVTLEACEIAVKARTRKRENPEIAKVRKRTEKWEIEKIEAHINKMKNTKNKGSKVSFENKLHPWTIVLNERIIAQQYL